MFTLMRLIDLDNFFKAYRDAQAFTTWHQLLCITLFVTLIVSNLNAVPVPHIAGPSLRHICATDEKSPNKLETEDFLTRCFLKFA